MLHDVCVKGTGTPKLDYWDWEQNNRFVLCRDVKQHNRSSTLDLN